MDLNGINPQQLQMLLNLASAKLGVAPNQLKENLQNGNLDSLGLSADQQNQIGKVLSNPQALAGLMQNPQLMSILSKLNGGR